MSNIATLETRLDRSRYLFRDVRRAIVEANRFEGHHGSLYDPSAGHGDMRYVQSCNING